MEATNEGAPLDDVQTRWKPVTVAETATDARSNAPPPPRERAVKHEEAPPREGPRVRRSWTGALLETDGSWAELGQRAGIGVLLAASYGVALGARDGGIAMLTHAAGVPAALVAVAMLGLPALYVVLALFDAPLSVRKAGGAAVAGVVSAGLVLAGIAPLAALYVVTSGSADAASVAGGIGLALGGLLGLRHLAGALRAALETADSATRFVAALSQTGFAVFAMLLAWRVWSSLLPLVGGAS